MSIDTIIYEAIKRFGKLFWELTPKERDKFDDYLRKLKQQTIDSDFAAIIRTIRETIGIIDQISKNKLNPNFRKELYEEIQNAVIYATGIRQIQSFLDQSTRGVGAMLISTLQDYDTYALIFHQGDLYVSRYDVEVKRAGSDSIEFTVGSSGKPEKCIWDGTADMLLRIKDRFDNTTVLVSGPAAMTLSEKAYQAAFEFPKLYVTKAARERLAH